MRERIDGVKRGGGFAVKKHLTAHNIEGALKGMPDEIDLLSIDVDGNDYWLWNAIERISARLVVIEMNRALGPHVSVTIPYDPDFKWDRGSYYGASLRALAKLGKEKGYRLIGCEPKGVNAFFLRNDIKGFGELNPIDALDWDAIAWGKLPDGEWVKV